LPFLIRKGSTTALNRGSGKGAPREQVGPKEGIGDPQESSQYFVSSSSSAALHIISLVRCMRCEPRYALWRDLNCDRPSALRSRGIFFKQHGQLDLDFCHLSIMPCSSRYKCWLAAKASHHHHYSEFLFWRGQPQAEGWVAISGSHPSRPCTTVPCSLTAPSACGLLSAAARYDGLSTPLCKIFLSNFAPTARPSHPRSTQL